MFGLLIDGEKNTKHNIQLFCLIIVLRIIRLALFDLIIVLRIIRLALFDLIIVLRIIRLALFDLKKQNSKPISSEEKT